MHINFCRQSHLYPLLLCVYNNPSMCCTVAQCILFSVVFTPPSNGNVWLLPVISLLLPTTLKKNYGTHVIKLDIAPKAYPLGQHFFISASNNMFYRHSQWDKRHTICVVNLMPQDTKIKLLNRSCLGSNLQSSGWVIFIRAKANIKEGNAQLCMYTEI